jgi:hypothetical protein
VTFALRSRGGRRTGACLQLEKLVLPADWGSLVSVIPASGHSRLGTIAEAKTATLRQPEILDRKQPGFARLGDRGGVPGAGAHERLAAPLAVVIAGLQPIAMAAPTAGPSRLPNMLFLVWIIVASVSLARRAARSRPRRP